jgi:hypothetical protein
MPEMKKLMGTIAFALACAAPALAGAAEPPAGVIDEIKQFHQDYGVAIENSDIDRIRQILSDDWRGVATAGRAANKAEVLASIGSGKYKLEWFEIGPMDVKLLGDDIAVVQATVQERRNVSGKTESFSVAFLDVMQKRGNGWVIVRSQAARLK